MKLSFVIPAYNEEARVGKCLESVLKEIAGKEGIEVVVVNNASTDRTKEIAMGFPGVRVVDEMQKGLVRARQAGYKATTGELIANVDSDTILPQGWVTKVLRAFETDRTLVALSGPYIYYDLSLLNRALVKLFYFFGYVFYLINHFILHKGAMLQGGNFILRRTALDKIDGFDTSIEFYGEDTDIANRISKVGKVRWTFSLPMYTSGRRLKEEGVLRMGYKYALNFLVVTFRGKPHTKDYKDIRSS